jgi:16S rRNA (adenine1518-N6/adenine1519-N6)-dimethyltransferase
MPQTLSQIKAVLAAHGLRPKHRHGQNFLVDHNHLARIVAAAALVPGEVVLEVGPGTGTLTQALLDAQADLRVIAVEIDAELEPILRQNLATPIAQGRVELIFTDILENKHTIAPRVLEALHSQGQGNRPDTGRLAPGPFKLIANLPYHVASPLLVNLVVDHPALTLALVMVQREVADRLTAGPATKAYGPLGIILQAACAVERVAVLSPGCFWPAPEVASAVVRIERLRHPLTDDLAGFAAAVHRMFAGRRKQLGALLGRDFPFPPGIAPTLRAEALSVEQLVELSRLMTRE